MSTYTPDKRIPFTEIAVNLDRTLDQADPQREAALAQLSRVRSAKMTAQAREQKRLAEKLGALHPRVKALAHKREVNAALLREVNLDLARAATPEIDINDNTWLLHGRVLDRAREGQSGLTSTLIDAKGGWVRELGYACTDKRGYFRLSVEKVKTASDKPEAGRETQVYLRITDRSNKVLHTDKPPLTPRPGQVDYREITLGEPPAECRAPEGGPTSSPCLDKDYKSSQIDDDRKPSKLKPKQ
ncbi:hypothetical protein [Nitrosospira sp. NRS527]|uniref:hypothetical protein n=1 Tax=Nitrosospira sp. NRS527 TaxID=155925 RepID=UPI001AF44793|nr:hypothetical protein [Nitrosospira sp. NRS527]BCT67363.1 hypothetical protein NNRS527_00945 [Nitrosospira sp. NRS527]